MPELNLYLIEKDEYGLVELAIQEGCELIPDLHYDTKRYDRISTLEQYRNIRGRTRLFFLVSDTYFRSPIEMRRIERDGRHIYYISQRSGGPAIQFLGGGLFEENHQAFVRPGSVGYYPTYWNTTTLETEKPPVGLRSVYKVLKAAIQDQATRARAGASEFWLCAHAREAVLNHAKLVGFENYPVSKLLGD